MLSDGMFSVALPANTISASIGRDGIFRANQVQAKCASKYAPAPNQGQPAATPMQTSQASGASSGDTR